MDFHSVSRMLLGSKPDTQWYEVRVCRIEVQEITGFCEEELYSGPGDPLLDGRLLPTHLADLHSVCERLLGSTPAIQRFKVHLCNDPIDTSAKKTFTPEG